MQTPDRFAGLVVPRFGDAAELRTLERRDLPAGDTLVRVRASSLNYKDALALTSRGTVLRTFPCVPGIDLAGEIVACEHGPFSVGDEVLATGFGLGEVVWGGFAQYASVRSDWLIPVPPQLGARLAMAVGTAGVAAALSVLALQDRAVVPGGGDILVTGAAGGVGSIAIILLSALGHRVVASTGRPQLADYLRGLGAAEIVGRLDGSAGAKPLESARWAGAIDSVGGAALPRILAQLRPGAAVAACGLAGGAEFSATVMPFILRSVSLVGINTVDTSMPLRRRAWDMIASASPRRLLEAIAVDCPLDQCAERAERLLGGEVHGRTVIVPD